MSEEKRLAILIGHTAAAQGANGIYPIAASEYVFNSEIAAMMFQRGMEMGLPVKVFKRDGVGIRGAYLAIEEWAKGHSTVCIELHFNAANGKARGSETLYDSDPKESAEFASLVHSAICISLSRKDKTDRGIKLLSLESERGYLNLNICKIPSVIVEPAFCDNKEDAALLYANKKQYAMAMVDAAARFLNSLKT